MINLTEVNESNTLDFLSFYILKDQIPEEIHWSFCF